ncbi:unnamed protein product [Trichobilharzia regenti]|nr:unnamed protein product [Trichobilharzia regenti]
MSLLLKRSLTSASFMMRANFRHIFPHDSTLTDYTRQVLFALRSLEPWADNLVLSTASSDCGNHQSSVFLEANSSSISFLIVTVLPI